MSDSEEENFDISNALALKAELSSEDESSSSDSEEVQDEILSSDEESESEDETASNKQTGKTLPNASVKTFPALELSDDEGEANGDDLKGRTRKPISEEDFFASLQQEASASNKKKSVGSFAGMGLSKYICANIAKKGFRNPTPIQRKTIPLVLEGRDVVGMARTGSGKTAAFVLPMLEKLKVHSARVGARAVILSPSRELALQTQKVVKDFSRGTDLRSVLLVGGDSLEDQFGMVMSNPDIIIATPGRFLHLKVEMQLDLGTIEYIVFDEADRLFELGFSEQLNEILGSLAENRQTLLFSATLPRSLVDFAKAGLQDPVLVRLDAETKISDELEMAYFGIKNGEREGALAYILQSVIKMPFATSEELKYLEKLDNQLPSEDEDEEKEDSKKKKFKPNHKLIRLPSATELPSPYSTIVFTPTKHHVEYISNLLKAMGYAVSYIYGTLDQTARKDQLHRFRAGKTTILVVTDVAARGIDIPVLANVINYSLPSSPKVFIHRVGRTARAGRRGWAYTIVKEQDIPYLLDLELFLGRKLLLTHQHKEGSEVSYTNRLVLGSLPRDGLEAQMEEVEAIVKENYDIKNMQEVAAKGEKLYLKTRGTASHESAKRSKELLTTGKWDEQHLLFGPSAENERQAFLDKLMNRTSKDTVFEFKKTSYGSAAELMARRRRQIAPIQKRAAERRELQRKEREAGLVHSVEAEVLKGQGEDDNTDYSDDEETVPDRKRKRSGETTVSENELLSAFEEAPSEPTSSKKKASFRDPQFYMSHYATVNSAEDRAYSVSGSGNSTFFADAARGATFDLVGEGADFTQKQGMKWDKKRGKFVNAGSTNDKGSTKSLKFIRGEGGTKIPASYRSGRFDNWKQAHKSTGVKTGTVEDANFTPGPRGGDAGANKKYKHNKIEAPKRADRARDDYHIRKKRVSEALEKGMHVKGVQGKFGSGNGIQTTTQVRKARELKQKRRDKNARPSAKGGR